MTRDPEINNVVKFLKVYSKLKPRERDLLKLIVKLQDTAFLAPPHWDHEPTAEEMAEEDQRCQRSQRDFQHLESLVKELSSSLRSPFL